MTNRAAHAAAMLEHGDKCLGRTNLTDADLAHFAERHPDLRPVFEELQYLRDQHD